MLRYNLVGEILCDLNVLCLSTAERVDQPTVAGCSESINRGAKGPSDVCSQGRINRTWLVCFCACVCYFNYRYYLFFIVFVVVHVF